MQSICRLGIEWFLGSSRRTTFNAVSSHIPNPTDLLADGHELEYRFAKNVRQSAVGQNASRGVLDLVYYETKAKKLGYEQEEV